MKKPRPANKIGRKRRATGWMLLALGVIVAGVWVASRWWTVTYGSDEQRYTLRHGVISWSLMPVRWRHGAPKDISVEAKSVDDRGWDWWDQVVWEPPGCMWLGVCGQIRTFNENGQDTGRLGALLLWPLPLLLCPPAALLLRSGILARRRAMKGMCPKCGYSLAGLANDAPCPECGQGGPKAD